MSNGATATESVKKPIKACGAVAGRATPAQMKTVAWHAMTAFLNSTFEKDKGIRLHANCVLVAAPVQDTVSVILRVCVSVIKDGLVETARWI